MLCEQPIYFKGGTYKETVLELFFIIVVKLIPIKIQIVGTKSFFGVNFNLGHRELFALGPLIKNSKEFNNHCNTDR